MDSDRVDSRGHWDRLGRFLAKEAGNSPYVELGGLVYQYWEELFPDAVSVDDLVDGMEEDIYDHYEQWVAVTWSPDNIAGGTVSLLGILTFGEHRFIALEPDFDTGVGWLLMGAADDKEGAIWNFLVDLLHPDCPIPDMIEADMPPSRIKELLRLRFSDDPASYFGWEELGKKLALASDDRELLLDRYLEYHVRGGT